MRQRPDHFYRQSGVIPVREEGGNRKILLITSKGGRRWIIPKGIVEPGLTPLQSAIQEAWEEAGIRGAPAGEAGTYRYPKWGGVCTVQVFVLAVEEESTHWPEESFRTRRWCTAEEAGSLVAEEDLKSLLLNAGRSIAEGRNGQGR